MQGLPKGLFSVSKIWLFSHETKGCTHVPKQATSQSPPSVRSTYVSTLRYGIPNRALDVHPEFSWFRGWLCFSCFFTWRPCCLTTNDLSMKETWVWSEVVGRCFWFMNRLQVFSYIVDVIGVCWLERHLYQFVTSLWFNHVIFLHFDKECFSSETRDAGVLVVHVGGPSWTVRNPWMLCFFQVNWPRDNTKSWKSGKGELSLWGWILKCNLTCSETYVKHVIMYVDSIRTCDMKNLDPDSSVGPDESHVDNCEAFPLLL